MTSVVAYWGSNQENWKIFWSLFMSVFDSLRKHTYMTYKLNKKFC